MPGCKKSGEKCAAVSAHGTIHRLALDRRYNPLLLRLKMFLVDNIAEYGRVHETKEFIYHTNNVDSDDWFLDQTNIIFNKHHHIVIRK